MRSFPTAGLATMLILKNSRVIIADAFPNGRACNHALLEQLPGHHCRCVSPRQGLQPCSSSTTFESLLQMRSFPTAWLELILFLTASRAITADAFPHLNINFTKVVFLPKPLVPHSKKFLKGVTLDSLTRSHSHDNWCWHPSGEKILSRH